MDWKENFTPHLDIFKRFARVSFLTTCLLVNGLSVNGQTPAEPGKRLYQSKASALPNSSAARAAASIKYAVANRATSVYVEAPGEPTPIEKRAFDLTNSVRIENGRAPLAWDADLYRLARGYSEKMATLGFFAHVEPDGSDLRDRARTAGIRYRAIGENIAYNRGVDDPGASTVQRWMDSSAHRSNLLGREYRASAVGVFVSPEGRIYITQLFITR